MSLFKLSPSVDFSEIDASGSIFGVSTSGGAYAGHFADGPVLQKVLVSGETVLKNTFGKPTDDTFVSFFTCANFLLDSNSLTVVRVVGDGALNATSDGTGLLIKNLDDYTNNYAAGQGSVGNWAAKYPSLTGNSIIVSIADAGNFATWAYKRSFQGAPNTSTSAANKSGVNDEIHIAVIDRDGKIKGTPGQVLETFQFASKGKNCKNEDGTSNYYPEVVNRGSRYIYWMGHPTEGTNWGTDADSTTFDILTTTLTIPSSTAYTVGETVEVKSGVVASVPVSVPGSGYTSAPTVAFTGGGGSGATATAVLGTTGGVRAVTIVSGGTGYTPGTYTVPITGTPGSSGTVALTVSGGGVINTVGAIVAGTGYTSGSTLTTAAFDLTSLGGGSGASLSYTVGFPVSSITIVLPGSSYESSPTASLSGGGFSVASTLGTVVVTYSGSASKTGVVTAKDSTTITIKPTLGLITTTDSVVGATSTTAAVPTLVTTPVDTDTLAGGVLVAPADGDIIIGYDLFSNADNDLTDVTLILTGNASQAVQLAVLADVAEARRDCVAFLSPPMESVVNNVGNEVSALETYIDTLEATSYGFFDDNYKYQYDKYNDTFRWVPLNGDIAGLAARTAQTRDPWFSFAGYTRGKLKNVVKLAWNPTKEDRDALVPKGVNSVITSPGQGPILYSDVTMLNKPSAFGFINVRFLFIVMEKSIATAAKFIQFEFNDEFTRAQFRSSVEPFLRDIKGRRGIINYQVVCDSTNNPGSIINEGGFVGDIYVDAARSIRNVQLNFIATPDGVSFDEIIGKF